MTRRDAPRVRYDDRPDMVTPEQAQAFLQVGRNTMYELLASKPIASSSIRITRQLTTPGPEPTFGPPKNGCSREVTLSAETMELLREHKRTQAELKMANRTTYRDLGAGVREGIR